LTKILSPEQILIILRGIEEMLRMLQAKSEYRQIESTEEFTRSNDFNLMDVIHVLGEVQEGIENFQSAQSPENNGG
jgi:hypothetical protein